MGGTGRLERFPKRLVQVQLPDELRVLDQEVVRYLEFLPHFLLFLAFSNDMEVVDVAPRKRA